MNYHHTLRFLSVSFVLSTAVYSQDIASDPVESERLANERLVPPNVKHLVASDLKEGRTDDAFERLKDSKSFAGSDYEKARAISELVLAMDQDRSLKGFSRERSALIRKGIEEILSLTPGHENPTDQEQRSNVVMVGKLYENSLRDDGAALSIYERLLPEELKLLKGATQRVNQLSAFQNDPQKMDALSVDERYAVRRSLAIELKYARLEAMAASASRLRESQRALLENPGSDPSPIETLNEASDL